MLDDHYTTEASIWIVIMPMLVSVYVASLLIVAVLVNVVDELVFVHSSSLTREIYIYGSIFFAFMFSSFSISISTYIAVPVYKNILMVIVFFVPIIWPKLISLYLFGIENTNYELKGINIELVLFVSGSILGGFIAYNTAMKFRSGIA
ncbi:MAG: hypothetical protein ACC653_05005 [Gammaproteobacteria bacterium]